MEMKLRLLDVVRTKRGTLAVVTELNEDGEAAVAFAHDSMQKYAWYKPSELRVIGNVKDTFGGVK
jgi:hypothetical protein